MRKVKQLRFASAYFAVLAFVSILGCDVHMGYMAITVICVMAACELSDMSDEREERIMQESQEGND